MSSAAAFRQGVIAAVPIWLAVGPFGAVFGAVAMAAGLDIVQTMAMTMVVVAGAAQLAALQLMADDAPALIAVLTGAVVNLRMAMYSAALAAQWPGAPLWARAFAAYVMVDGAFALSVRRHAEQPAEPVPQKMAYYFGAGSTMVLVWIVATWVGALFGAALPPGWGIEFAVPVTFIAAVAPILRTLPHVVAALVASVVALVAAGLPYGGGLMVAAASGVLAGAGLERALAR